MIERLWYPYREWEDYKNGMYDITKEFSEEETEKMAFKAKDLLSDLDEFYHVGLKVLREWKCASNQNLSNLSRNRQAWLGQAACSYKFKIPEKITILGWRLLSPEQQKKANIVADQLIMIWEDEYAKAVSKQKCLTSF